MSREKENENSISYCISMGSKTSKSCATENMKQTKELDIDEKAITDTSLFNTLKDVINRVEISEERKSDKMMYRLPIQMCNYSLFK